MFHGANALLLLGAAIATFAAGGVTFGRGPRTLRNRLEVAALLLGLALLTVVVIDLRVG